MRYVISGKVVIIQCSLVVKKTLSCWKLKIQKVINIMQSKKFLVALLTH